jgi:hypothetical protein
VHLSGKADAGDRVAANAGGRESAANRQTASAPPIAWILFRPTGVRRCERGVLFDARAEDAAFCVDDQDARAAGANVNSENVNGRVSSSIVFLNRRAFQIHARLFQICREPIGDGFVPTLAVQRFLNPVAFVGKQ